MQKRLPAINLLKKETKLFDKITFWALSIGRVVVIATEFIALGAFLYRFSLDKQVIDLRDQNKNKETVIKIFEKNEQTYRDIQARLQLVSSLISPSFDKVSVLNDIEKLIPPGVLITSFQESKNSIILTGNAQTVFALATFVNALKVYPHTQDISLDRLDDHPASAALSISLSVTLK